MMINKWYYSVFLCILSVMTLSFLNFSFHSQFKLETSVWCHKGLNDIKLCKFKNICYDSQFKAFLFFLGAGTVIKGFENYSELQKIQLSSVYQHNQFYANISVVNTEDYKLEKDVKIISKTFLVSRFKPNNIMHSIHDDIFPMFLTLESICLGDISCMDSYNLIFHDNHPEGPFYNLYNLFSKNQPVILNEFKLKSNLLCFKEMVAGLIVDGVFYQYGFKKPHGPINNTRLTQNDILRFTSFLQAKLKIPKQIRRTSEVILFKRQKNRKILNIEEVKGMVENVYEMLNKKIQVKVIDLDLFSDDLTTLISNISKADGIIGMHGAEMILSLFLKPNSFVFELFPFGINPEVVSFIKPISHLEGSHFKYFSWRNFLQNNSVAHPNAHPLFGGITHLDEVSQNKIKNVHEVPPVECCNNPIFLYHMYQDTLISNEFRDYLYKSILETFTQGMDLKPGSIIKNWFHPYKVSNITCSFLLHRRLLHINWHPPFNVNNFNNLLYNLYIQDENGLFSREISTDETLIEVEVPVEINPVFEVWISVHFKKNHFKSPDLYLKCF